MWWCVCCMFACEYFFAAFCWRLFSNQYEVHFVRRTVGNLHLLNHTKLTQEPHRKCNVLIFTRMDAVTLINVIILIDWSQMLLNRRFSLSHAAFRSRIYHCGIFVRQFCLMLCLNLAHSRIVCFATVLAYYGFVEVEILHQLSMWSHQFL